MGVPGYRISEMVKNGGKVIDAFGFVNVVSPAGIPMRGIVGIAPDPLMFVAINCENVQKSKSFYEQLGFVEQVSIFTYRQSVKTPVTRTHIYNTSYRSHTLKFLCFIDSCVSSSHILQWPNLGISIFTSSERTDTI